MKVKVKYLLISIIALGVMAFFAGTGAAEDGPYVYIRYFNNGTGVDTYVYWNDSDANGGPYDFAWADDVLSSGDDLDWQADTPDNAGTANAVFKLPVTKYINYFFRVSDGTVPIQKDTRTITLTVTLAPAPVCVRPVIPPMPRWANTC